MPLSTTPSGHSGRGEPTSGSGADPAETEELALAVATASPTQVLMQAPFGLVAHKLRKQANHWRQATSKEQQLHGLHAALPMAQLKSALWAVHLDTEVPKRQLHLEQSSHERDESNLTSGNTATSKRLKM
jgi:membrane-bound lytic murein transglycosylase B